MIDITTANFQTVGSYTKSWSGQTGFNGNNTDSENRTGYYTHVAYTNDTDAPQMVTISVTAYVATSGSNVSCVVNFPPDAKKSGGTGVLEPGKSVSITHSITKACAPSSYATVSGRFDYTVTLFGE